MSPYDSEQQRAEEEVPAPERGDESLSDGAQVNDGTETVAGDEPTPSAPASSAEGGPCDEGTDGAEGAEAPTSKLGRMLGRNTKTAGKNESRPRTLKALWQGSSVWKAALLGTLVYLVFVNVGYFLFMKPIGERLAGLQERAEVLHDFAVVEEASAAVDEFTAGLMSGDQRMTVMSEVNEMGDRCGVRVVGDPDLLLPRDVSTSITQYPIRLRVRGTYDEIGEFLSLLESSPRFIQVEQVEIQSDIESRERESEASMLLAVASWEG